MESTVGTPEIVAKDKLVESNPEKKEVEEPEVFLKFINEVLTNLLKEINFTALETKDDLKCVKRLLEPGVRNLAYVILVNEVYDGSHNNNENVNRYSYKLSSQFTISDREECVAVVINCCSTHDTNFSPDFLQILRVPRFCSKAPTLAAKSILNVIPPLLKLILDNKVHKDEPLLEVKDIGLLKSRICRLEVELDKLGGSCVFETNFVHHPEIIKAVEIGKNKIKHTVSLEDLKGLELNPNFIVELEKIVQSWITLINKVTYKIDTTPVRSANHELTFWKTARDAIESIEFQLNGNMAKLSLDALGAAKKFRYKIELSMNPKLKKYKHMALMCDSLMRKIKLDKIYLANDVESIKKQVLYIHKLIESNFDPTIYSVFRMTALFEYVIDIIVGVLNDILQATQPLLLDYDSFKVTIYQFLSTVSIIDVLTVRLKTICNLNTVESLNKKSHGPPSYVKLRARLKSLADFRNRHEKSLKIVQSIDYEMTPITARSEEKINYIDCRASVFTHTSVLKKAYVDFVSRVSVSDIEDSGTDVWNESIFKYNNDIMAIEGIVTSKISALLDESCNRSTVSAIISKYSSMLEHNAIHAVIKKHGEKLFEIAKLDLDIIKNLLDMSFKETEEYYYYYLKGLSHDFSKALHCNHMRKRLTSILKYISKLSFKDFTSPLEGRSFYNEIESLCRMIRCEQLLHDWINSIPMSSEINNNYIFSIRKKRSNDNNNLNSLYLNLQADNIGTLRDYVTLGIDLEFVVPHKMESRLDNYVRISQYIPTLEETVHSFINSFTVIAENKLVRFILESQICHVIESLEEIKNITYNDIVKTDYSSFIISDGILNTKLTMLKKFIIDVLFLEESVTKITSLQGEIDVLNDNLKTCLFERDSIYEILDNINRKVMQISIYDCNTLIKYINTVDASICNILSDRFNEHLVIWENLFLNYKETRNESSQFTEYIKHYLGLPLNKEITEEISNQELLLSIDLELSHIIKKFNEWIDGIINAPILIVNICKQKEEKIPIRSYMLNSSSEKISKIILRIINKCHNTKMFCLYWIESKIQLGHNIIDIIFEECKDNLDLWKETLEMILEARKKIEKSNNLYNGFPWQTDVQKLKFNLCEFYYKTQVEVEKHFHNVLLEKSEELRLKLNSKMKILLDTKFNVYEINAAVDGMVLLKRLKLEALAFSEDEKKLINCFLYLKKVECRYVHEMELGPLSSAYRAFKNELDSDYDWMNSKRNNIIASINLAQNELTDGIIRSRTTFDQFRASLKDITFDKAKTLLNSFRSNIKELEVKYEAMHKARRLFQVEIKTFQEIEDLRSDIDTLYSVYENLKTPFDKIMSLENIPIINGSIESENVIDKLESVSTEIHKAPKYVMSTAVYTELYNKIKLYLKKIPLLKIIGSGVLKMKHFEGLGCKINILETKDNNVSFRLGTILNSNIEIDNPIFKSIYASARAEKHVEDSLNAQEKIWNESVLILGDNNDQKVATVSNIDQIIDTFSESQLIISKLKNSPYFKLFAKDIINIEERLALSIHLFDLLADVQRQLVYMAGIFMETIEMERILPSDAHSLNACLVEYHLLFEDIKKFPASYSIAFIKNATKILNFMFTCLKEIKRSLLKYIKDETKGNYRFHFLGKEELLEMLGGGVKSILGNKYLGKMFTGVSKLVASDDNRYLTGLISIESEHFEFENKVELCKYSALKDILGAIEVEIKYSLAIKIEKGYADLCSYKNLDEFTPEHFMDLVNRYPFQVSALLYKILFTNLVQISLEGSGKNENIMSFRHSINEIKQWIEALSSKLLISIDCNSNHFRNKIYRNLMLESMRQFDIVNFIILQKVESHLDYLWISQLRIYYETDVDRTSNIYEKVSVKMLTFSFKYGYEYHGVPEFLVYTSLVHKSFMEMCLSISNCLGGCLFGPSGSGKTEVVKFLGISLGRRVMVFCYDNKFSFKSIGSILVGICISGAWGCFDEFNRLEQATMSAISLLLHRVQTGLKYGKAVSLLDEMVNVNTNSGIFVTMNPNYLGRSEIPANIKPLFRNMYITNLNAYEVACKILHEKGFTNYRDLASKIVNTIDICRKRLYVTNTEFHYDFSLRMLKNVLKCAGKIKGGLPATILPDSKDANGVMKINDKIIADSLSTLVSSRFTKIDKLIYNSALKYVFCRGEQQLEGSDLSDIMKTEYVCNKNECVNLGALLSSNYKTIPYDVLSKIIYLHKIMDIMNGVILVGCPNSGKTLMYTTLFDIYEKYYNRKGHIYTINPNVLQKEDLFGYFAPTGEWEDGLFTAIIRKLGIESLKEENMTMHYNFHWIIFDGDINPDWVENLNSALDENKQLTLQNGEHLFIPSNVRIIFETNSLKNTTLATLSRCGLVRLHKDMDYLKEYTENLFKLRLRSICEDGSLVMEKMICNKNECKYVLECAIDISLAFLFKQPKPSIFLTLELSQKYEHCVPFSPKRYVNLMLDLTEKSLERLISRYNMVSIVSFANVENEVRSAMIKELVTNLIWSFSGDMYTSKKIGFIETFLNMLQPEISHVYQPPEISESKVQYCNILGQNFFSEFEYILENLIPETSIFLVGPTGSGKQNTIFSTLERINDIQVLEINFSSATTVNMIISALEHACNYLPMAKSVALLPKTENARCLVVICTNLDFVKSTYYNVRAPLCFLQQLQDHKKFWHKRRKQWVEIKNINFICTFNDQSSTINAPVEPFDMPIRLFEKGYIFSIDESIEDLQLNECKKILHNTALNSMEYSKEHLDEIASCITEAYLISRSKFHMKISPQSLYYHSRQIIVNCVNAASFSMEEMNYLMNKDILIKILMHEIAHCFGDRLCNAEDEVWMNSIVIQTVKKHFGYSADYEVKINEVAQLGKRYSKFCFFVEKVKEIKDIICTDETISNLLKIRRALNLPNVNLLIVGPRCSGKNYMLNVVAKIEGINIVEHVFRKKYTIEQLKSDIKNVLTAAVVNDKKTCFLIKHTEMINSFLVDFLNDFIVSKKFDFLFYKKYVNFLEPHNDPNYNCPKNLESDYKHFISKLKSNFKIVIISSEYQDTSSVPLAFYQNCTTIYMKPWSDDFLREAQVKIMSSLNLNSELVHKLGCASTYVRECITEKYEAPHRNIVPWNHINFMNHFIAIHNTKISELEDNKEHLIAGIEKINAACETASQLKLSQSVKESCLKQKDEQARDRLAKMLENRQESEKKRVISIENRKQHEIKRQKVEDRRMLALGELSKIEPLVSEAKANVGKILKSQLAEVRTMTNPPLPVKIAVESVCVLLGHKIDTWKDVQAVLKKDDFISSILNYKIKEAVIDTNTERELESILNSNKDINIEVVNRASKACGPLYAWALAQYECLSITARVYPLKLEVATLEKELTDIEKMEQELSHTINDLEKKIMEHQQEYSSLMNDVQTLKFEIDKVQNQLNKYVGLLDSLSSEKKRWELGLESYQKQLDSSIGNSFLAAVCISYFGPLDENCRTMLLKKISHHLNSHNITNDKNFSIVDYMFDLAEKMKWRNILLDDVNIFCMENVLIILKNSKKCPPLLLDSSNKIHTLLSEVHKSKHIDVFSFKEPCLAKKVSDCVKFGVPVLLKDAEFYDPTFDNLIRFNYNRNEFDTATVNIGLYNIEVSPTFFLFLSSEKSISNINPHLLNHTNVVNFATTDESISNKCLNFILKNEGNDLQKRKKKSIKLQGEYSVRLKNLEDQLLMLLSDTKINFVGDSDIISTLVSLKNESTVINKESETTDLLICEIDNHSKLYEGVLKLCCGIYNILKTFMTPNVFNFSVRKFFLDAVEWIIERNKHIFASNDFTKKSADIEKQILKSVFSRASRYLKYEDMLVLGLLMFHTMLNMAKIPELNTDYLNLLLNIMEESKRNYYMNAISGDSSVCHPLDTLSKIYIDTSKKTSNLMQKILSCPSPTEFLSKLNYPTSIFMKYANVFLTTLLRVDSLIPMLDSFLSDLFDCSTYNTLSLKISEICEETSQHVPIIILFPEEEGDIEFTIETVAVANFKKLNSVSLGSIEACEHAERTIFNATSSGEWVLLKGAQYSLDWLKNINSYLKQASINSSFKLLIAMNVECHSVDQTILPDNFSVIYHMPSIDLKHAMLECISRLYARLPNIEGKELRVFFMFCWIHSIVRNRIRYAPIGWTRPYNINILDFDIGIKAIKELIELRGDFSSNFFDLLLNTIFNVIYKLFLDVKQDAETLMIIIKKYMHSNIFLELNLTEISGKDSPLILPQLRSYNEYYEWIEQNLNQQALTRICLPYDSEKFRMENMASSVIAKTKHYLNKIEKNKMNSEFNCFLPEEEGTVACNLVSPVNNPVSITNDDRHFMDALEILQEASEGWNLEQLDVFDDKHDLMGPVDLYFKKEIEEVRGTLSLVKKDIKLLKNDRETSFFVKNNLMGYISKDITPPTWRLDLSCVDNSSINAWMTSVPKVITNISQYKNPYCQVYDITNLTNPTSLINAIEQKFTLEKNYQPESLALVCDYTKSHNDIYSLTFTGIKLQGGAYISSDQIYSQDCVCQQKVELLVKFLPKSVLTPESYIEIPVYNDKHCSELLFNINFKFGKCDATEREKLRLYGVSLVASSE